MFYQHFLPYSDEEPPSSKRHCSDLDIIPPEEAAQTSSKVTGPSQGVSALSAADSNFQQIVSSTNKKPETENEASNRPAGMDDIASETVSQQLDNSSLQFAGDTGQPQLQASDCSIISDISGDVVDAESGSARVSPKETHRDGDQPSSAAMKQAVSCSQSIEKKFEEGIIS